MKGSLIIVGFFVLGALCGVYHLIPYDFTQSKLSFYALCALMFSVGVPPDLSTGHDHIGNTGRMRSGQSVSLAPLSNRLYGSRCRFRLLLSIQYLYYRI